MRGGSNNCCCSSSTAFTSDAVRISGSQCELSRFAGTGAFLAGGRWNSAGGAVVYAAECLAGSLLEILAHAGRRARLPGRHHCARAVIPDGVQIEVLSPDGVTGSQREDSLALSLAGVPATSRPAPAATMSLPGVPPRARATGDQASGSTICWRNAAGWVGCCPRRRCSSRAEAGEWPLK